MKKSLFNKTISGIKWSALSQIGRQVLQYLTTIILVGLLSPDDFGIMAMAIIVIGFAEVFKDLGTSSAIIQLDSVSDELKSTVFYTNIIFGSLITILIFIFTPLFAEIYNSTKVIPILRTLSFIFFISSFSLLQKSLLEKELSFQRISCIEVISSGIAFFIAIILALNDFGVWSLVFQTLSNVSISSLLIFFFSKWKPGFFFHIREVKTIFKFSINLIGFNFINYFSRNSDYFIIGIFLGDKQLGHYYLAYRIMLYPVQNLTQILSRVIFPSLSKIKNEDELVRCSYIRLTNNIAFITFPLMTILSIVSFSFTETFFSNNWNSVLVSELIIILAPVGALQSVISTVGNLYLIKGRTDLMLNWGLVFTFITVLGFFIGIKYGIIGVALSYLISNLLILYPVFAIPFTFIRLNVLVFFKSFSKILLDLFIMIIVLVIISNPISQNLSSLLQLITLSVTGVILFILLSFINNKKILQDLILLVPLKKLKS